MNSPRKVRQLQSFSAFDRLKSPQNEKQPASRVFHPEFADLRSRLRIHDFSFLATNADGRFFTKFEKNATSVFGSETK